MALLRGELDWVVMKCLEKQRDRRYETANALARDVQRYLADEMVEARPPSAGYRLRKFARKHRAALASATAIAVLLVAGLSVSLWQMFRAIAAEGQANQNLQAEQQARADETKARQQAFAALRSMTDDVVERKFAQGSALTEDDRAFLRGVIAQFDAFAAIKGDDADSRALRAEGRLRVGNMRSRLGELLAAEQDFDQALGLYQQLAADFSSRPDFRRELGNSHNSTWPAATSSGVVCGVSGAGCRRRSRSTTRPWASTSNWRPTSQPVPGSATTWPEATTTAAIYLVPRAGCRRRRRSATRP
jgi:hypothetical protein